ncbi:MAG: porphobilinogen synthase [Rhodothermales bacterium]|nr:porphobilinogen synthase [Rhodothermales bacterium]
MRLDLPRRPRRLRRSEAVRSLVRESRLHTDDLVMPLFVTAGEDVRDPIVSMPGQARLSVDRLVAEVRELQDLGIRGVALFPVIPDRQKDPAASGALDPDGLYPRAIRALKDACPDVLVITDVALDPYSSDGHDGLVRAGRIHNDATLAVLADMAVVHAEAGADFIAPSDMMDGRVKAIRTRLDGAGVIGVGILAYTAKYASNFYGPFRDALDSAPRERRDVPPDKKTYQMDPANVREAMREAALDLSEGADILMVKPGLPYLDVVRAVRDRYPDAPLAVYNVSGEYAMVKAAAANGWLDERPVVLETLGAFKRAGADIILTYHARAAAEWLRAAS